MLVPKANGNCLDPARPNKGQVKHIQWYPKMNDIVPRLAGTKYLKVIEVSLRYNNLKYNDRSSCLTTFSCLFGRYGNMTTIWSSTTGDMFQKKMDELFSGMANSYVIADDILIAGFGKHFREHNKILEKVLGICRQWNLKLNKINVYFVV